MKTLPLLPRPYTSLVVLRDAGMRHPDNDLDEDRLFTAGEQIDVRLDHPLPLRQRSLNAEVVGVDEDGLRVRSLHSVYAMDGGRIVPEPVVKSGEEFLVPRRYIFGVTKVSRAAGPHTPVDVVVRLPGASR